MATKKTARGSSTKSRQRGRGATKTAEAGITRVLSVLDKQLEARLEQLFVRLIWRLGLASQKDLIGLSTRVNQLERDLRKRRSTRHLRSVGRKPPASPPESGSSSSGHSAA